jgi:hypothetical protein
VVGIHLDNIKIGPDSVAIAIAADNSSPASSPIISAATTADAATLTDKSTKSGSGIIDPKPLEKGDTDRGLLCA